MKKKIIFITALFVVSIVAISFKISGNEPWVVPDKNAKMANPVKSDAKTVAAGKKLYLKYCEECHGKKGIGDGTKAPDLKTQPKDLSTGTFQSQTDGAIFYKISEGRGDMPKMKKELTDADEIWNIVNYVRTLKK